MIRSSLPLILLPAVAACCLASSYRAGAAPREVRWKKTVLDTKFRSEGVSVADVNRDGKPDVLTGDLWYEAPDWKPHEIRPPGDYMPATGYSNCFFSFAQDVDHDRWPDEIVIGFPGAKSTWFRNPGKDGGTWTEYPVNESACNETPNFTDLDGDGTPELVTPFQEKQMAYYRIGEKPQQGFEQHLIGEAGKPGVNRFSHGLGVGDLNGDGRKDILCKDGYYEAPADRAAAPWKFVPVGLGPDCANMYVEDFNGDGLPDVITSSAHNIGVWWWEQVRGANGPEFKQHLIDNSFSESHSMMRVDINGDGHPDFVTGKRWWAHGPNGDVNPNDPAVLYWFEFKRNGNTVEWTKHEIDNDSGVGTQFAVADLNGDKHPDIIISNKKGVFVFVQER